MVVFRWLIRSSLEHRLVVATAFGGLVACGLLAGADRRIDLFGDEHSAPLEIRTECPGLSPEQVESLVTAPLEDRLMGTPGLEQLTSSSVGGWSTITLHFESGIRPQRARQLVQENLVGSSWPGPDVVGSPVLRRARFAAHRALKVGLSSDQLSLTELSDLAQWTIRPRMMAVPGVVNVAIWGLRVRELQVLVDPDGLRAHGVTLAEVLRAAGASTRPYPGGFLQTPTQRLSVGHRSAIRSVRDLEEVVVKQREGASLRLGDVAKVVLGHRPPDSEAVVGDGPGLLLAVELDASASTLEVSRAIERAMARMGPGIKGVDVDLSVGGPATSVRAALAHLGRALGLGSLLVLAVLGAFLWSRRTVFVAFMAMAVSFALAALALRLTGSTFATTTWVGLLLAWPHMVSDAVVGVENIVRHLRAESARPDPVPFGPWRRFEQTVAHAILEGRSSLSFALLIVASVLILAYAFAGPWGAWLRPMAGAYALAVLASWVVSLTLVPALARLLLDAEAGDDALESAVTARLYPAYRRVLAGWLGGRRSVWVVLGALWTFVLISLVLASPSSRTLGTPTFVVRSQTKSATALPEVARLAREASRRLRSIAGVRAVAAGVGRAHDGDAEAGVNTVELAFRVDEGVPEVVTRVRSALERFPGLGAIGAPRFHPAAFDGIAGASTSDRAPESIVVRLYGDRLAELRRQGERVRRAIADIAGATDFSVEAASLVPQVQVTPDPEALAAFGMTPSDVHQALAVLIHGQRVGTMYEGQKRVDIVVRAPTTSARAFETLGELVIDTPAGGRVRLRDVAAVQIGPSSRVIRRDAGSRRIEVVGRARGRGRQQVVDDIEAALASLELPLGYHADVLELGGRSGPDRSAVMLAVVLGLVVVLILLHARLGCWLLAVPVLVAMLSGLAGGVVAAALSIGLWAPESLVGLLMVWAIVAQTTILLLTHYRSLERQDGMPFGVDLVVRGSEERLTPVVTTSFVIALALISLLATGTGIGGFDVHVLGTVVLAGLLSSTIVGLFVVPALYLRFGAVIDDEVDLLIDE